MWRNGACFKPTGKFDSNEVPWHCVLMIRPSMHKMDLILPNTLIDPVYASGSFFTYEV